MTRGTPVELARLEHCASTQDEVRARLAGAAPGTLLAVATSSQSAGRGRAGRSWQDPPGAAILLSVGLRGPAPIDVLEELPARIGEALLALLDPARAALQWKPPNDLVAADDGAKVAGILVDARTTGTTVDEVVVGVGCNGDGRRFRTTDGRDAATLTTLGLRVPDAAELAAAIADQLRVTTSG